MAWRGQFSPADRILRGRRARTLDAQVAADEGFGHVDVLDLDLHFIYLPVGLLRADKLAAIAEKGRCIWKHGLGSRH